MPNYERNNWKFLDISGIWCEFLHKPGHKYHFDDVEKEIKSQTEKLASSNKGICHEEINLKVYSNKVIQLTLVDLPGIVKV